MRHNDNRILTVSLYHLLLFLYHVYIKSLPDCESAILEAFFSSMRHFIPSKAPFPSSAMHTLLQLFKTLIKGPDAIKEKRDKG